MTEPHEDPVQGMLGALDALREVAADPEVISDWPAPSAAFEDKDYETIIRSAWRHQFSNDRSHFKRQIRELEEKLSDPIIVEREKTQE